MTHQHVPTDNRPPAGKPERCRECAAVIHCDYFLRGYPNQTECGKTLPCEDHPVNPPLCDLCLSGIPHMCPGSLDLRMVWPR